MQDILDGGRILENHALAEKRASSSKDSRVRVFRFQFETEAE